MNCVDWHQASAYCAWKKQRLPTEIEGEYAARGQEYRATPGATKSPTEGPAGSTWAEPAKRARFAGAFGLYDIAGNVWEWTSSSFGPYPWPAEPAFAVYRGGSSEPALKNG
jgi:formylglycine-generating enzyme required for sulfatase activity